MARKSLIIGGTVVGVIVVVVVVVGLSLGLTIGKPKTFKETFIARCKKFKGNDCQKIWSVFEQAYVGRDHCNVPMGAYDPLIKMVPFEPACNRMMFWSKTPEKMVHDFTKKRDFHITLGDTLLGSALDNLTWCGKQGSSETFITDCPSWMECENNPVRSFWNRASAAFADVACGDVTVMLNGDEALPFHPTSTFARIEVKRFRSPRVKSLKVVLVTKENTGKNCANDASLRNLQKELDHGIKYNCQDATESEIQDCISHPNKPCGPVGAGDSNHWGGVGYLSLLYYIMLYSLNLIIT